MPMMPFIGVRISWLILARKSDLRRVASLGFFLGFFQFGDVAERQDEADRNTINIFFMQATGKDITQVSIFMPVTLDQLKFWHEAPRYNREPSGRRFRRPPAPSGRASPQLYSQPHDRHSQAFP